jgi:DNA sulfur modification protein DndD
MRLNRLTLRDFGLFRGVQVLDLASKTKYGRTRPIVLIGGHNGAGKTTILHAIRLCLYGRLALGMRVREADYELHLRQQIHHNRGALIQPSAASICLEFEHARAGEKSVYTVERSWEARSESTVDETLSVARDGEPLSELDSQFWSDFVRSLIPLGVSDLFFFDGEKIQRLAEANTDAATLAESVKALLGLDLVERLAADLDVYNGRQLRKTVNKTQQVRLAEIDEREKDISARMEKLRQDEAHNRAHIDYVAAQVQRVEDGLAQRGEGLSLQRGALRQKRTDIDTRIEEAQKELRILCEGPLPFAACPKLASELLAELDSEEKREVSELSRAAVSDALATVAARLTKGPLPKRLGWTADVRRVLSDELASLTQDLASPADDTRPPIHGLSAAHRAQIRRAISEGQGAVLDQVTSLASQLTALERDAVRAQETLNRMPEGDELAPLVRELSGLQQDNAKHALELRQAEEERARLQIELDGLLRERARIIKTEEGAEATGERVKLAGRVRAALDEYLARLTTAKISELEATAAECFQLLCRKDDLVRTIKIDPANFNVTLLDSHGRSIPKDRLSAGEKQIYAVAILWALTKVSGRPLPMIIDTPLGRLDSHHRRNLVERYFPFAAHQVIILSTDTEVDDVYFQDLRKHMSHAIQLVSHPDGWSEIQSGYFWKENPDARASA